MASPLVLVLPVSRIPTMVHVAVRTQMVLSFLVERTAFRGWQKLDMLLGYKLLFRIQHSCIGRHKLGVLTRSMVSLFLQ
jgi:hypothetical protein